jgi:hypothetical protein
MFVPGAENKLEAQFLEVAKVFPINWVDKSKKP